MNGMDFAYATTSFPGGGFDLILAAVLPAIGFIALAGFLLSTNGGAVDRPNRVPQLYAYAVCFVAVLTFLFSVESAIESTFTLASPESVLQTESGFPYGPSLSSFEAYRATLDQRTLAVPGAPTQAAAPLTDTELHARYDALRADRLAAAHFRAVRSLVIALIFIALAIVLFVAHWRWARALRHPSDDVALAP